MTSEKFDFIFLPDKTSFIENKHFQEHFLKWSMKGNLRVKYYNFNQPFKTDLLNNFVEDFFKSPTVYTTLEVLKTSAWSVIGEAAETVEAEIIPCSVTSMAFFDPLIDTNNKIVRAQNHIIQRWEEQVGDFYVTNNLQACLLDEQSESFALFSKQDRDQFIFRLLTHFVLGGMWCQHEEVLDPYLQVTKEAYKDLISVDRVDEGSGLAVRSLVVKVKAFGTAGYCLCPSSPRHLQNFAYLIIDSFRRQVSVIIHQFHGPFVD